MTSSKNRSGGNKIDGPQSTSGLDPNGRVRLVTPNQAKREAYIRGELSSARPKVTLPKFSWDKKDD
jgi:hypothetical protein